MNNHRVYGVYSPEPCDEVFCVKLNFVWKLGHYVIDLRLPKRRLLSTGPIEVHSSNMSNTRDSVSSGYPNTEKRVENTTRSGVFLTNFELFG